jgi:hypothetical protein
VPGLFHRDIESANITLNPAGEVKLHSTESI